MKSCWNHSLLHRTLPLTCKSTGQIANNKIIEQKICIIICKLFPFQEYTWKRFTAANLRTSFPVEHDNSFFRWMRTVFSRRPLIQPCLKICLFGCFFSSSGRDIFFCLIVIVFVRLLHNSFLYLCFVNYIIWEYNYYRLSFSGWLSFPPEPSISSVLPFFFCSYKLDKNHKI